MPSRFRSRLLVLALVALVFSCFAQSAAAKLPGPPRRHLAPKKPTLGQRAVRIALREVGVPYSYGGASPSSGFDCSGLVYWAYGRLGVSVPHSSYALYGVGRSVPRTALRAGDILFFSGLGHVGLYVGRGRMVHAPQTGENVKVVSLRGSNYGMRLVAARRLVR
jgi:cell wall-associated NlpC family hydrolase